MCVNELPLKTRSVREEAHACTCPEVRCCGSSPGVLSPPTHLVDARVTLLLLGGCVQTPERRKPAPPLAGGAGHGLSSPPHSRLACAGCHLRTAGGHTGGVRPRTRSPRTPPTSPSNTAHHGQHRPHPLHPGPGPGLGGEGGAGKRSRSEPVRKRGTARAHAKFLRTSGLVVV